MVTIPYDYVQDLLDHNDLDVAVNYAENLLKERSHDRFMKILNLQFTNPPESILKNINSKMLLYAIWLEQCRNTNTDCMFAC